MNLQERVVGLLRSAEEGNVLLAAKLLQSVNDFDEELRIFLSACNDDLKSIAHGTLFHTLKYIEMGKDTPPYRDSINFVGKRWIILLCPGDSVYLMKSTWNPEIKNVEV